MTPGKIAVILVHAFVGWALCGATMGIGMALARLGPVLVVHAIGAPIYFWIITLVYVKKFGYTTPLQTSVIFLLFVVVMDFFVVALIVNRSLEMFTSALGTWIPFALIFASTYVTASYFSRKKGAGSESSPGSDSR